MNHTEKNKQENRIAFLAYQSQALDELHLAHLHARELAQSEEEQEQMARAFEQVRESVWQLVSLIGLKASKPLASVKTAEPAS